LCKFSHISSYHKKKLVAERFVCLKRSYVNWIENIKFVNVDMSSDSEDRKTSLLLVLDFHNEG